MDDVITVDLSSEEECHSTLYDVDERLRLHDGKICTTRTPIKNGKQAGWPEYIDVTEQVIDIIRDKLKIKDL